VWEKAAELARSSGRLNKDERDLLDERGTSRLGTPLLDTINAAKAAEQKFRSSKLSYVSKHGETIIIRERFDRFLKGFQRYTNMIHVMVGASEYAMIVWGTLRFFLQASRL